MTVKQLGEAPGHSKRFSATANREFVHRHAVSEVFPTDIVREADSEFTVWAQWPRWHVFYGGLHNGFDSAILIETLRQLTVLIAHTQLDVPLGKPFLMPEMAIQMVPGQRRDGSRPVEVSAHVKLSGLRKSLHGLTAFQAAADFHVDGQDIATGTAAARIVDPVTYARFRAGRNAARARDEPISPVSASQVGHTSSWNVVLGQSIGRRRWPLRVDISNPIFFDHALDHVPGVLLIESVRQALRLELRNPHLDLADFNAQFLTIVELEAATDVVLESLVAHQETVTAVISIQSEGAVVMRTVARVKQEHQPLDDRDLLSVRPGQPARSGLIRNAQG